MAGRSDPGALDFDVGIGGLGGLHFDPFEMNDLVEKHGIGAELRQAVLCPCIRPETGHARASCPDCRGLRWLHPEALRQSVIVLLSSRNLQRQALAAGHMLTGTAQVTFPIGIVPGEGDLLLPEGEEHVVSEILYRAQLDASPSRVRALTTASDEQPPNLTPRRERLLYPDIVRVEHVVYWTDSAPAGRATPATRDHDWRLGADGAIEWVAGRGPAPGAGYSVRYVAPAAYMLFPAEPKFRSENGQTMLYSVLAQRLDRWGAPAIDTRRETPQ